MENGISEKRTKELMTEVLSEMMHDKREVFYEMFWKMLDLPTLSKMDVKMIL